MIKQVGNGETTKFWKDKWLGGEALVVRFTKLFSVFLDKDASIEENGKLIEGEWK